MMSKPAAHLALLCAALMCALPALVGIHVLPLASFYEEWLAAALGTTACLAMLFAARKYPLVTPPTLLPLFGLLAVLVLQIALGKLAYTQQATLAALYVIFAMALAWCGAQLRETVGLERASHFIAWGLCMGGLLSATLAIVQAYLPSAPIAAYVSQLSGGRAFGNLNQANLFGDQLALAGAALLYLHAKGRISTLTTCALGIVLAVGLTLSGSRGVWLYMIGLFGWTFYLVWRTGEKPYRKLLWRVLAATAVLIALAYVLPPMVSASSSATAPISGLGRLAEMSIESGRAGTEIVLARSDGVRVFFWQHAWHMFINAPLLGVGFGQFGWAFTEQSPAFSAFAWPGHERHAHNLVLHLLAETGLFGAASVLLALGWWAWRMLRAPASVEIWWIAGSVGVVLLHSLVEYPLWYAHFLGPFALLFGLGEARPATLRTSSRVGFTTLAGVVVLGALVLGSLLHGVGELRRWIYLVPEAALQDPAVVANQQQAIRRLEGTLLRPYVELPLAGTLAISNDRLAEKLAFNDRVMRFAPIGPILFRQIVFLSLADRGDEAQHLFDRAAVLYPGELPAFAADLDRLAQRGLPVSALVQRLTQKQRHN